MYTLMPNIVTTNGSSSTAATAVTSNGNLNYTNSNGTSNTKN
jgi:hypothetical protein